MVDYCLFIFYKLLQCFFYFEYFATLLRYCCNIVIDYVCIYGVYPPVAYLAQKVPFKDPNIPEVAQDFPCPLTGQGAVPLPYRSVYITD